jgi:hypothetical protein
MPDNTGVSVGFGAVAETAGWSAGHLVSMESQRGSGARLAFRAVRPLP